MGKTTIEVENISKSVKGEILFKNFSYNVKKFDRLGIVGENGVGKTTLFKSILGLIPVDFGTITIGKTINIGYFAQEIPDFNKNMKMIDYLKSFGEYVDTPSGKLSASQISAIFFLTSLPACNTSSLRILSNSSLFIKQTPP